MTAVKSVSIDRPME